MYDVATLAAMGAPGAVVRDFLFIRALDFSNAAINFGYWTGEDSITTNVVSAIDGTTQSHAYVGLGSLTDVPPIVDQIGLNSTSFDIGLNHLQLTVVNMLHGDNIRVAVVELHRGYLDPATYNLVSTPFPRFLGYVDTADTNNAAPDGEGGTTLSVIQGSIDLTITNPAMKTDAQLRADRSGDRFRKHADTASEIEVWWGQAKGSA